MARITMDTDGADRGRQAPARQRDDGALTDHGDNAVRRLAEIVHVGTLSNCIFDVSKAACLTQRERDEGAPTPHINMCSPDKCGNAVVGACHVPKWKALKDEVDEMMRKARSGPQRASLKAASNRYDAVIRKAEGR